MLLEPLHSRGEWLLKPFTMILAITYSQAVQETAK